MICNKCNNIQNAYTTISFRWGERGEEKVLHRIVIGKTHEIYICLHIQINICLIDNSTGNGLIGGSKIQFFKGDTQKEGSKIKGGSDPSPNCAYRRVKAEKSASGLHFMA